MFAARHRRPVAIPAAGLSLRPATRNERREPGKLRRAAIAI